MGLLQETCDAIHSRSKEIEQHIIKNWNDASDSKQYGPVAYTHVTLPTTRIVGSCAVCGESKHRRKGSIV